MRTFEALERKKGSVHGPETPKRCGVALAAALAVLAGSWLAGGKAAAQPPAPVVDFTVSETKTAGPGAGEWTVKTEVKNNTAAKATIVSWSWPAANGGAKIGKNEWEPAGTQPKSADPNNPDHKQPKDSAPGVNPGVEVDAGKTVTQSEVRDKAPHSSYVRVFQKNANGTWTQKTIIAHNVHLAAFLVPKTNPVTEYVTLPVRIPYPTDLPALTGNQPADFFIKNVSLPEGWQTAYLGPALEERFRLLSTQREFTGILVAKPMKALAEGEQAIAQITWGVELDGKVMEYEFTIRALLVSDSLPPTLAFTTQRRPEGTWVSVTVQDPGGVHHGVHLEINRQGSHGRSAQTLFLSQTRALVSSPYSEIGATTAVYETLIPGPCDATETLTLQASASDQFGNSGRSATQTTTADIAMASATGGKKK